MVNPKKSNGFLICTLAPLICSYATYLYFNDDSLLIRSILAPLLVFLYLCDILLFEWVRTIYWKAIIPLLALLGFLYCPPLLYSIIQLYVFFYSMEAIPPIFTAGETLINSFVLTTLFQFSLTTQNLHSAIVYYPVLLFFILVQILTYCLDYTFSR